MQPVQLYNNPRTWDNLWSKEIDEPWRAAALDPLYSKIVDQLKKNLNPGQLVVDIGGGNGSLADKIKSAGFTTLVTDHSQEALRQACEKGHSVSILDLEDSPETLSKRFSSFKASAFVCTEVIEHLTDYTMLTFLNILGILDVPCYISTPNNKWGPDEEPQHARKLTVVEYSSLLKRFFSSVRIECFEPWYQLAICGEVTTKKETISVCFPARDEQADIEKTLKSFRPIADEIVVGIDPRSTDRTEEIARQYAEVVFTIEDPQGQTVDGEEDPRAVHFSHIRNQCIDHCNSDWIFMTEAHESLNGGHDTLLRIGEVVPKAAQVGLVYRTGQYGVRTERWGFPWLVRRSSGLRYSRRVHNILDYDPNKTFVAQLPQVVTLHDRSKSNAESRGEQRKVVNRKTLMEDWVTNGNESSLFYLGSEWRMFEGEKGVNRSIDRLEQLLALPPKNGPMRYQARLVLAITYVREKRLEEARQVLLRCPEDDWTRIEHWIWLGDIAFEKEDYNEALQWYRYASTMIKVPPFTLWWIDLSNYTYLPAQRLAMTYSALGDGKNALQWAEQVVELLPSDAPEEMVSECVRNRDFLRRVVLGKEETSNNEQAAE